MFGWKAGATAILEGVKALHARAEGDLRQQLHDERIRFEVERSKNLLLAQQLATSQANVEWLRVMVNSLSNDRAAIALTKGLVLPALQVEGELRQPAEVVKAAERQASGGAPAVVGAALAEAATVDDQMQAYRGHVGNFEDVGDELARDLGVDHEETVAAAR